MGRILEFLTRAAGVAALSGPLGRWRQLVSKTLDDLQTAGTLDVIETRGSGPQTVSNGTDVLLPDTKFSNGSIAYSAATGIYTLVPGKLYELDAGGLLDNFSNTTAGFIRISWCDTDNNPLASELPGFYKPTTSTVASSDGGRSRAVFRPANATEARVKLRVVSATGTAEVGPFFGSVIKELR
jgi:hypothetical protein